MSFSLPHDDEPLLSTNSELKSSYYKKWQNFHTYYLFLFKIFLLINGIFSSNLHFSLHPSSSLNSPLTLAPCNPYPFLLLSLYKRAGLPCISPSPTISNCSKTKQHLDLKPGQGNLVGGNIPQSS